MSDFTYDEDHFIDLASKATTLDELDIIDKLWIEAEEAMRLAALKDLRAHSIAMLDVVGRMIGHIEHLGRTLSFSGSPVIKELKEEMGRLHAELHTSGENGQADDPATPDPGSD
ncbi:MAG: hypothetical protein AAGE89_05705 [Pseudomonadota bacterium]